MLNQTILNATHRALGARMVDFGGWDMPINYGSQIDEHHAVRRDAGMFDVSHMTIVDVRGPRVREFLRILLANNVDKLKVSGKALYSCMLNEQGGVIDDLIVYFVDESFFRVVVNASTRDKDLDWMARQGSRFGVTLSERRDFAMVAVQGPKARDRVHGLLSADGALRAAKLGKFSAADIDGLFVARTGYTGEDGYEIMVPEVEAVSFWNKLVAAGVKPCGLGARDTLRLEAGMNLYGQDMDETVSPWEAALAWTISLEPAERDFIGRAALVAQKTGGSAREMIGLVLDDKGVLRHGQRVITRCGDGEILSGSFAPTLGKSIAFARVPAGAAGGPLAVDIRGKALPVRAVTFPFVRDGHACAGI